MTKKINFPFEKIAFKRIDNYYNRSTIVFLHDSLGCIKLWRDFPEKLSKLTNCNVLIYDRQGYGESCNFLYSKRDNYYLEYEADILSSLLDFLKIKDVILFGHSDGASISLIMAGKYSDKINGLIVEGAHVFVEDITIEGIKKALDLYNKTDLKIKLEKYHGEKTQALFDAWVNTWLSTEFKNWNIENFLPLINSPVFVIQGENDEYGTLDQVNKITKKVSGKSTKLIIPEIGHSPHKESPDLILEKSSEFIKSILEN